MKASVIPTKSQSDLWNNLFPREGAMTEEACFQDYNRWQYLIEGTRVCQPCQIESVSQIPWEMVDPSSNQGLYYIGLYRYNQQFESHTEVIWQPELCVEQSVTWAL